MSWARRLKRVFGIEIEDCGRCGGKLKIIASIEEPGVIAMTLSPAPQRPQSVYRIAEQLIKQSEREGLVSFFPGTNARPVRVLVNNFVSESRTHGGGAMKIRAVLSLGIACLILGVQPAKANSVNASDDWEFFSACAHHLFTPDYPALKSCAIGFWYGKLSYNGGIADGAATLINSPGWPVACPLLRDDPGQICVDTYAQYDLYYEAANLAGEEYNYWLAWQPPEYI